MDSVLLHDMKNLGFRLRLLLGNLEQHYGDPEFKRSALNALAGVVEKLDTTVARWSSQPAPVLIKVPLDLNDLVAEVLGSTFLRDGSGPASTAVEAQLADVPRVWGDPHYLREALSSIFLNALEAAGPDGTVSVLTSSPVRGRRRALIEFRDDGPGMAPEFVKNELFRPFRSTKPQGVGLGLYTARQIVRFHHGTIRVFSKAGEGTVVRVSLPEEVAEG
jgi:signal transduction histidine kinase